MVALKICPNFIKFKRNTNFYNSVLDVFIF